MYCKSLGCQGVTLPAVLTVATTWPSGLSYGLLHGAAKDEIQSNSFSLKVTAGHQTEVYIPLRLDCSVTYITAVIIFHLVTADQAAHSYNLEVFELWMNESLLLNPHTTCIELLLSLTKLVVFSLETPLTADSKCQCQFSCDILEQQGYWKTMEFEQNYSNQSDLEFPLLLLGVIHFWLMLHFATGRKEPEAKFLRHRPATSPIVPMLTENK